MNSELINLILTNVLVTGLVSTIVSYFVSVKLKDLDFRNEYYKQIVERRLEAYQNLEKPISDLKSIVIDTDHASLLPYHSFMNEGKDGYYDFLTGFMHAFSNNLWLDDNTKDALEELNQLIFAISDEIKNATNDELIEIGKKYYKSFSNSRINLENAVKEGLYNLHDIKKALKVKKHRNQRLIHSTIDTIS